MFSEKLITNSPLWFFDNFTMRYSSRANRRGAQRWLSGRGNSKRNAQAKATDWKEQTKVVCPCTALAISACSSCMAGSSRQTQSKRGRALNSSSALLFACDRAVAMGAKEPLNQNRRNIICTLGEWMPPHQHHAINESGVRLFYDISCCMEKMCPTFFAHWQSARWSRTYGISWNIDVVQNWAFLMPQMPRQGRRDFLAKCRSQNLRTIFRNLSIGLPS